MFKPFVVSVARFPLEDPQNVAPATSYFGDTDLGLETQGYRKKCLQHQFSSKCRERLLTFQPLVFNLWLKRPNHTRVLASWKSGFQQLPDSRTYPSHSPPRLWRSRRRLRRLSCLYQMQFWLSPRSISYFSVSRLAALLKNLQPQPSMS